MPLARAQSALKSITLSNAAGDSAKIYTFGACVTSYVKGGVDTLMVRPDAKLDGSKPISGGIPFCFPQFGPGAIQQHGPQPPRSSIALPSLWWRKALMQSSMCPCSTLNMFTLNMQSSTCPCSVWPLFHHRCDSHSPDGRLRAQRRLDRCRANR